MTAYEDLDDEGRAFLEGLHAQLQTTAREHQERRLEAGLPEPSGPPNIPPGATVTATFVDLVDQDGELGVSVEEHQMIWPDPE
jgi:hypothetical protein